MRARSYGVLFAGLMAALAWAGPVWAGMAVKAVRTWSSPEYSRITLELSGPPSYKLFTLKNPDRVVIDLQGVDDGPALQSAGSQVAQGDPMISGIRAALNQPGVTRVVVELKGEANPKGFTLTPFGDYGDRLVVDLYPSAGKQADNTEAQVEKAIAQASNPLPDGKPASAPDSQVSTTPSSAPPPAPTPDKPAPDKQAIAAAAPAKDADAGNKPDKTAGNDKTASTDKPRKRGYVRLITIAIDAGHGGEDPGATGASGSHEKDITLEVARRLKAHIDAMDNMHAVLTRDGDYFIPLHERVVKARKAQADLFVSIHADAFPNSSARGSSVFALSEKGATSVAARWLAKHENDADLIGGVNIDVKDRYLKQTLIDLTQTATISDSLKLGRDVLDELGDINNLHRGHVEQAGFAVLKAPDIPSILVETAFISNPSEEKRLLSDAYQERLVTAISTGIKHYFDKNPPLAGGKVARNM